MFDYTKAAISQTIDDLKKVFYFVGLGTQVVYIAFLVYSLIVGSGIFFINLALAALSLGYLIFYLIVTKFGKDPDAKECKRLRKTGKEAMKWTKRSLRLVTICIAFVEIFSTQTPDTLSVVLTAFMLVGWILEIVFDLIVKILTSRYRFIMDGLELDIDEITKPFKNVGNFFKKMTGQEVAPEKELNKNQLFLKEKVLVSREERQIKKQNEKIRKKQEAKELKKSTKAERALLKEADKKQKAEQKRLKKLGGQTPPALPSAEDNE